MAQLLHYFWPIVLAIGLYLFIISRPRPALQSSDLSNWHRTGKNFTFRETHTVFYKGDQSSRSKQKNNDGPVLVCLHGFPSAGFDWYKIWPNLTHEFTRVIAPDFLGLGFSDKPKDYAYPIKDQADLVEELLVELSVTSVHILAHDYGDTVAQELMARHNEKSSKITILSVCFLNGGLFPAMHHPTISQRLLLSPVIGQVMGYMSNFYLFRKSIQTVLGPASSLPDFEFQDWWALLRVNDGQLVTGRLLSYIAQRLEHEERWLSALKNFKQPLNLIYGPADPVNPPPYDDHFRKVVPNGNVDVLPPDIGHYPQVEDPSSVVDFYFSFLRRNGFI